MGGAIFVRTDRLVAATTGKPIVRLVFVGVAAFRREAAVAGNMAVCCGINNSERHIKIVPGVELWFCVDSITWSIDGSSISSCVREWVLKRIERIKVEERKRMVFVIFMIETRFPPYLVL